ncbi:hypothetical protein E0H39_29670 [Rhizobium leguminosarum bv. viciae]|uniref:hypothetical protein n=1 Tax=Rhizobium leguminosarum TaxID=384 RepID=UPI0010394331|nr:hypothetical protein [Rhizobium leguminosarum]TBY57987.1 hypothetical protein E0H39_29670 [Rhizobium leguminosarum bv. viciae]
MSAVTESGKFTFLARQSVADIAAASKRILEDISKLSDEERVVDHPGLTLGMLFRDGGCHVQLETTFGAVIEANRKLVDDDDDVLEGFRTIDFSQLYAPGYVSFASVANHLQGPVWSRFLDEGVIVDRLAA